MFSIWIVVMGSRAYTNFKTDETVHTVYWMPICLNTTVKEKLKGKCFLKGSRV